MSAGAFAGGRSGKGRQGARGAVFFLLAVAVLVGLAVLFADDDSGSDEPLDPQGWRKEGAHALAELLRQQGVQLRVVRTVAQAKAAATKEALLLVTNSRYLSGEQSLRDIAALPGDLVVTDASYSQLRVLAPEVKSIANLVKAPRQPGCAWSGALRAGVVEIGGEQHRTAGDSDSCYDGTVLRYRKNGRTVAVLDDNSFMSNAGIAAPGAAALALNLVGTQNTVVWLAPLVPQSDGEKVGPNLMSMVPEQVWWTARMLAVAVALTALWQVRRLGPVVVERLPVVVRASETAEGLGKLYQARRARGRAAAALREAALDRLSKRLALPARSREALVPALAARANRRPEEVGSVLYGRDPDDDSQLVALAQELDNLELGMMEHGVGEGKARGV